MTVRDYEIERKAIIETCLAMNSAGINQGKSGNVSLRTGDGLLITASGIDYEAMEPRHVVEMDLAGGYYGDFLPSSEWRMHSNIYRARPEAGAVVHTHSRFATALSCLRREVPAFHYMIGVTGGSSLRCAEYATFGTEELSRNMLAALEGRTACLLANHGMICFAGDLKAALALAVEIESLCAQFVAASSLGDPVILEDTEMESVLLRFKSYGKQLSELSDGDEPAFLPPKRLD